jgi:DNA anti-recombination protein RmuC
MEQGEALTAKNKAIEVGMLKELVSELHNLVSDIEEVSRRNREVLSEIMPSGDSYDVFHKKLEDKVKKDVNIQEHTVFNELLSLKERLRMLQTHEECLLRHIERI